MATYWELHHAEAPLLLPKAWGLGSALAFAEGGFSNDPSEAADFVAQPAALGAAVIHVEDSTDGHLVDPGAAVARVAAVMRSSPAVFVSARVDDFLVREQATVDAVVRRAGACADAQADAGADGILVPGLADPKDIRSVAA